MQKKRPWLSLLVMGAAAAAGPLALAAGFGASAPGAVLGQPLDFYVQLRLDPGEALSPECVSAEVMVGDRRLQSAQVRTALEMQSPDTARIRVLTTPAIDEPVVGVQVHAGCAARVSRRFVLLADPPLHAAATAAVVATPLAPAYAAAPAELPAQTTLASASAADGGVAVAAADTVATRSTGLPPTAAAAREPRAVLRALPRAERRAAQRRAAAATARAEAPRRNRRVAAATAVEAAPRLKLDAAEPAPSAEALAVEQAIEAVAQAASAARASAAAASAADARIATLERTVGELRAEGQGGRDVVAQLRARLARSDEASRWIWPLTAGVLVLAGLAAWLALRLAAAQRQRHQAWQAASAAAAVPPPVSEMTPSKLPTAPIPFVTSELRPPEAARPRGATPAWPPPAPVDPWAAVSATQTMPLVLPPAAADAPAADNAMQRTEVLPLQARADEAPPRDVSIEELIDLEQQAEFFVVLGQDDAAIDLLVEHLRNTGGGSPLPYLKLLEIYRRRGDREDYERMRARFNQRFNAYAPEWGSDLAAGRTLEDYGGIVPRLQQAWTRPLDAMAEMEALLFRKSRGDLFELPAYRELLFLYSLARDLLDREAADSGNVDLLLPMADGGEFSSTTPAPFLGLERNGMPERHELDDRPTAPVDFDLSAEIDRPTSIFDPLEEGDTRPRRR